MLEPQRKSIRIPRSAGPYGVASRMNSRSRRRVIVKGLPVSAIKGLPKYRHPKTTRCKYFAVERGVEWVGHREGVGKE